MTTSPDNEQSVLFVDDELAILDGLRRSLHRAPFRCLYAHSAFQALELLGNESVQIVVTDEQMPGMSGSELLSIVRQRYPEIIRIILSGQASLDRVINAVNNGQIHRFLTKPFDSEQLLGLLNHYLSHLRLQAKKMALFSRADTLGRWEWEEVHQNYQWSEGFVRIMHFRPEATHGHFSALFESVHSEDRLSLVETIRSCLESGQSREVEHRIMLPDGSVRWVVQYVDIFRDGDKECRLIGMLRDITDHKEKQLLLEDNLAALRNTLLKTVEALARMTELRDPYTAGHQLRVSMLSSELGKRMHLSPERQKGLEIASKLHDIGKIYVPAEFLSKPGSLRRDEMNLIKYHPEIGHQIVRDIPFTMPVADIILQHHERMDGSGYPHQLSGEDILLEARILAVADVFEAMSSHRPYRLGLGQDAALHELINQSGQAFDARVVTAIVNLYEENPELFAQLQQ